MVRTPFSRRWVILCSISCLEAINLVLFPYLTIFRGRSRHRTSSSAQLIEEPQRTLPPNPFPPQIDTILRRRHESGEADTLLDLINIGAGYAPSDNDMIVSILARFSLLEDVDLCANKTLNHLRIATSRNVLTHTPLP